ncbi:unnamed protein product [Urochloa decumbens]|uniref:F-box domain-containing protein n=1 Tax=Urochloa decumbens TaxID=240449 RepID=A0ABC8W2V5_9POAL
MEDYDCSPPDDELSSGPLKRRRMEPSAGGDRLSRLEDLVLGNILSFLPAKEAGRAALLSSRWRHVFAAVHTVSLDEPEGTDTDKYYRDPKQPSSFSNAVSLALLARHRRCGGAAPLRALRVAMDGCRAGDSSAVDQWVSYAVQQAAPGCLELDLRFRCRRQLCGRCYSLHRAGHEHQAQEPDAKSATSECLGDSSPLTTDPSPRNTFYTLSCSSALTNSEPNRSKPYGQSSCQGSGPNDDGDNSVLSTSSDDDDDRRRPPPSATQGRLPEHTVTPVLFSGTAGCAKLRSLSLSSCRIAAPATATFPCLETLLLSHVSDPGCDVEWLINGCPRLADLTIEACDTVTELFILSLPIRRLAVRCCHMLTTVFVNASKLESFEYRGRVPETSFLTMHGGSTTVAYCKIDICGEEVSSEEEHVKLMWLLQLFQNPKHLHLESARLSSGMSNQDVLVEFPTFSSLRHLELRGRLPDNDIASVKAVSRILEHTLSLEVLSLFFHPEENDRSDTGHGSLQEDEDLAHNLSYNPHSILDVPSATADCLRSKVREINLVHYQGGRAQRTLAKLLLCNAPEIVMLRCEFAEGPLWTQTQLMREIKRWVINKSANTHFA